MADPENLTLWSFGTWSAEIDGTGLVTGKSIKDGSVILLQIEAHPGTGLIDYRIGTSPGALVPRVFVRVLPGSVLGGVDTACALTMTALRVEGMDDARWTTLKATHVFELSLIKAALETGYDHRQS